MLSIRKILVLVTATVLGSVPLVTSVAPHVPTAQAVAIPTYAYLSGEAGHYNYVIDDATKTLSATIGPFNANNNWRCNRMNNAANHAGTKVIQTSTCQANAALINVADNTFTTLSFGATVMAFSNDDQYIYRMGYTRDKIKISDGSAVWSVGNGGGSYGSQNAIATSLDGTKLYVPFQNGSTYKVDVLNTTDGSTVTSISDPAWTWTSWSVAAPVGHKMYIGISNGVGVIDTDTDTIVNTFSFTDGVNNALSVSPDGAYLYFGSGNNVLKVNASTGATVDSWAVATGEGMAVVNPAGTHVYALNNNGAGLSIINISTGAISNVTLGSERSRSIVFVQQIPAPNISLSASSGSVNTVSAATGLYTISNTGGTPTSYSITPSLPNGLNFSTSTGLISGTASATHAATSYTITATNTGGSSTATFSLTVTDPPDAPTPTFSSATSTSGGFTFNISNYSNSYTYAFSATNGALVTHSSGSVTVTGLQASGTSAVTVTVSRSGYRNSTGLVNGRASDAVVVAATTTTVSGVTTTTVKKTTSGSGGSGTGGSGGTVDTTTAPTTTSSTTTTVPAPQAPTVDPGVGVVVLNGKESTANVTRSNNKLTVESGGLSVTFTGLAADGSVIPLDSDGNLRITGGDSIAIDASGFAAMREVSIWMFSAPTKLATITADSNGKLSENIALPAALIEGQHRFVLTGESEIGSDATVALGVIVGYESSGLSTVGKVLIAVPIALAIIVGLLIPTTLRRRKKHLNA